MSRILLIEDNAGIRENTSEILTLAGYTVYTAVNGREGVQKAILKKPDLIICDILMPELDGYGVIHALKSDPETDSIPFVFLSAKADRSDMRKGMEMGAFDYLTKPFDDTELLTVVKNSLNKKELSEAGQQTDSSDAFGFFFSQVKILDALMNADPGQKAYQFQKKSVIYAEGEKPLYLFYIVKGKIKTIKDNKHEKELITGLYKEGDFFGYIDLFKGSAYDDKAIAMEDCMLKLIPKNEFFHLMEQNNGIASAFMDLLSCEVKEREERLMRAVYGSVRKKVAESLILLKDKYGHFREANTLFSIPISREDLSQIAGTATETLIRTLTDFKDEGIIEIKGSTITIVNSDKLRQMKN